MQQFIDFAIKNYNQFSEKRIIERRFKHCDLMPLLKNLDSFFEIKTIGKSFEDREIIRIKIGTGKVKILLWSQMHGNESVATSAILDILNFFKKGRSPLSPPKGEKKSPVNPPKGESKNQISLPKGEIDVSPFGGLRGLSLYFIPMLNPDGAEVFKRRNAQDIDLNRDALKQSAPESKILLEQIAELKPDFGFNLHDQEIYYGVENTPNNTNIAFLAPAYNYEKSIDEKRKRSMQVIVAMNNMLQKIIPNSVAKYSDAFMPNAFGDNIQKLGTSTILIESGYSKNDNERQFIRKLNFISIITAIYSISNQNYTKENIENYFKIPANKKDAFFDYLLKNVTIKKNNKTYKTDIGISRNKSDKEDFTDYEKEFLIWEIGDLSNYNGFEEIDFTGKIIDDNENKIMRMKNADFLLEKL